jgi:ferredoxin
MKNIIFYFSGTGNSLKAAKDIAAILGDTELVFMKGNYVLTQSYDRVGFVFPCYAGGVPKAVLAFVRSLNLTAQSTSYIFSVITCNEHGGNCGAVLQNELRKKDLRLDYYNFTETVGNYIVLYRMEQSLRDGSVEQTLRIQNENVATYAYEIQNLVKTTIPKAIWPLKMFFLIGNQYFKAKEKKLFANEACTGCGLCEKLCPVDNIKMADGKPEFLHRNCAQCMACLQWCPNAAIDCGKKTKGRTRYHNPDVSASDLIHK